MSIILDPYPFGSQTVSASNSPIYELDAYFSSLIIQVTAVDTTPVVTVSVSMDGDQYSDTIVATLGSTLYASGEAITLTDGAVLVVPCSGFKYVKVTRSSGTSATLMACATQHQVAGVAGAMAQLSGAITNEDSAVANLATGIKVLGVRTDTLAASSGATGDAEFIKFDANGAVWTTGPALTTYHTDDLDETEEEISATAVKVYAIRYNNRAAAERFIKFYNATAANVTVGTTAPLFQFSLASGERGHISFPGPIAFTTALCIAGTTDLDDGSPGAPAANDIICTVWYK